MRADRLISILLLLQMHARLTARHLAKRLEVSERTIHRDMEALGARDGGARGRPVIPPGCGGKGSVGSLVGRVASSRVLLPACGEKGPEGRMRGEGDVRTYRVSRIRDVAILDESFIRPPEFDLA